MNKAIFQNHQQYVAEVLHRCNHSLDIAMCWFTNPLFFAILLKKARAGLSVRLLVQFDQANFHPKGLQFLQLIAAGGQVRVFHQTNKLFHHKFTLVDKNKLLTGSYNWTRTQHADNLLLTDSSELLVAYQEEFEALWQNAEPLSLLAKTIAPPATFHKLFEPILWDIYDLRHAILWGARVWISVFKEKEMPIWEQCLLMQRHFLKMKGNYFERNRGAWDVHHFEEWSKELPLAKKRLLKNYCIRLKHNDIVVAISEKGQLLAAGLVGSSPETGLEAYSFARYVQWFEYPDYAEPLNRVPVVIFTTYRGSGLRLVGRLMERRAA